MIMKIAENHHKYDQFVASHPLGNIHQTLEWSRFQTKLHGRDQFWPLTVEDEHGEIMASALVIRQVLPMGKCWLYSPRGPLQTAHEQSECATTATDKTQNGLLESKNNPKSLPGQTALFQKIRDLARAENAIFFRFEPAVHVHTQTQSFLQEVKSRPAHAHYQPENTLILDLTLTEEALLAQMKPKGRYNIKVAQKHGVKIRVSTTTTSAATGTHPNAHDIAAFYTLLQQTTGRDKFSGHNQKYYEDMLEILGPHALLYLAEFNGQPVAGLIATYFKDTATYYFGASSNAHRNTMAPYLLQWQAIKDAKAAGYKFYDFFGVSPATHEAKPNAPTSKVCAENTSLPAGDLRLRPVAMHPWSGVTDFKLKFGGTRVDYISAQEIVYQPFWYAIVKAIKWLKAGIR